MTNPKILLGYEKKWVALTPNRDKVLEAASTFKALVAKIKNIKDKNTVVTYVLPFDGYYSPLCHH